MRKRKKIFATENTRAQREKKVKSKKLRVKMEAVHFVLSLNSFGERRKDFLPRRARRTAKKKDKRFFATENTEDTERKEKRRTRNIQKQTEEKRIHITRKVLYNS